MSKYLIKSMANKVLPYKGLQLVSKLGGGQFVPNVFRRLEHMKHLGFGPKVIFDCGAYVGEWSRAVSRIFPDACFLLIEPNKEIIDHIKKNIEKISSKTILLNIAISETREIGYLNVWDNKETGLEGSSLLSHVQGEAKNQLSVEIRTLNDISQEYNLMPDIIKLDLQGAELAALKGASRLLEKTELFIIEFGCIDAYINRTSPRELFDIMYNNNYCLYDAVDLIYRPHDNALCGGDFFFLKNDSKLRLHKGFY